MAFTQKGKPNLEVGIFRIICVLLLVMRKEEVGGSIPVKNVSDAVETHHRETGFLWVILYWTLRGRISPLPHYSALSSVSKG